jgi:hypothetical protein
MSTTHRGGRQSCCLPRWMTSLTSTTRSTCYVYDEPRTPAFLTYLTRQIALHIRGKGRSDPEPIRRARGRLDVVRDERGQRRIARARCFTSAGVICLDAQRPQDRDRCWPGASAWSCSPWCSPSRERWKPRLNAGSRGAAANRSFRPVWRNRPVGVSRRIAAFGGRIWPRAGSWSAGGAVSGALVVRAATMRGCRAGGVTGLVRLR